MEEVYTHRDYDLQTLSKLAFTTLTVRRQAPRSFSGENARRCPHFLSPPRGLLGPSHLSSLSLANLRAAELRAHLHSVRLLQSQAAAPPSVRRVNHARSQRACCGH